MSSCHSFYSNSNENEFQEKDNRHPKDHATAATGSRSFSGTFSSCSLLCACELSHSKKASPHNTHDQICLTLKGYSAPSLRGRTHFSPKTKETLPCAGLLLYVHKSKHEKASTVIGTGFQAGDPREIRTPDTLIRSQVLYPAELLGHVAGAEGLKPPTYGFGDRCSINCAMPLSI